MAGLGVPGRQLSRSAYKGDPLPTLGRGVYNRSELIKIGRAGIRDKKDAAFMEEIAQQKVDDEAVEDADPEERGLLYELSLEREAYGADVVPESTPEDLDRRDNEEWGNDRITDAQFDWQANNSFAKRNAIYAKRLDKLGHDAVWLGGDAGDKATKRYKAAQAYYDKWIAAGHRLRPKERELQRWKDAKIAPLFLPRKKAPPAPHESLEQEFSHRPGGNINDTRHVWYRRNMGPHTKHSRIGKRLRLRGWSDEPKPKRLAFE